MGGGVPKTSRLPELYRAAMIFMGEFVGRYPAVPDMRQKPSHAAAFAAALIGVLAAWGARWLITPVFSDRLPFITFFPVVFLLAWWGGFWPTFYATILGSLVLDYAILEPVGSFYIELPESRFGLGLFAAIAM